MERAEQVKFVDRRNTDCSKWDHLSERFGRDDLVGMWVADMDFAVPQCVQDALAEYVKAAAFGYYRAPDSYYEAFIDWERKRHGYAVKREWMRFSPGVVPAINWLIQCMSAPGDAVIVMTPVYYPFLRSVENNGRRLVCCDLVRTNGRYGADFAAFERMIRENAVKLFILCSPHNPVGRVWTRAELEEMLAICRRNNVFVISDEIHHDLIFGDNVHLPTATLGDYDDMLATLTAPSKTFNLAGCQNSIAILPDKTVRARFDDVQRRCQVLDPNPFGCIAAEAAYRGGAPWLEAVKAIIYENGEFLRRTLLAALPLLVIPPLEGTYLMWIDFAAYVAPDGMRAFLEDQCGLAFDYGDWFAGTGTKTCVRVNLATSRAVVEDAAGRILRALGK